MAKVFILGPAGIGKTTLSEFISKRYRIPFIQGSSKVLWEKYQVNSHKELLNLPLEKAIEFQYELLETRVRDTYEVENYVSDRSVIDNAVYFLLQNSHQLPQNEVEAYINTCSIHLDDFLSDPTVKFIYLSAPKKGYPLEDDGMRINHLYYQDWVVGSMFDRIIMDKLLTKKFDYNNFLCIDVWDWESRVKMVETFLDLTPWEKFLHKIKNFIL